MKTKEFKFFNKIISISICYTYKLFSIGFDFYPPSEDDWFKNYYTLNTHFLKWGISICFYDKSEDI